MFKKDEKSFYERAKKARKVLVLDLGFLGDTIQLIPALSCIRKSLPEAQLDVIVSDHIMSILNACPWINNIFGYPRFPKGPPWYKDILRVIRYRREDYDVIINLNGSDRSSLLTWAIGAPLRLGRIPPKIQMFWKFCFTHTVFIPRGTMPIYKQSWECLQRIGFPKFGPEFDTIIPEIAYEKVDSLLAVKDEFLHFSPFTTQDYKELPIDITAQFINCLRKKYSKYKIVISCAPNDRERTKLKELLDKLDEDPWHVFPGSLNLMELAALISRSKMHLGGDSGAMHIATMTNSLTLSWFRQYTNIVEWLPEGDRHRAVIGVATPNGLKGITVTALVDAFEELLSI